MKSLLKLTFLGLVLSITLMAQTLKSEKELQAYYNKIEKIIKTEQNKSTKVTIDKDKAEKFTIPSYKDTTFFKDKENGYAYGYLNDGSLSVIVQLNSKSNIEGTIKVLEPNGALKILAYVEEYKLGNDELIFSGIMRIYQNGKLFAETPIYMNKINGLKKVYFPNGNIREEFYYTDNEENVLGKQYYENGKIRESIEYKNGIKDGKFLEYYPSGKLKSEVTFKNDKPTGKAVLYDENGKVLDTKTF